MIHILHFLHPSVHGHLDCFHLVTVSRAVVHTDVQICLCDPAVYSLDIYRGMELLDSMVILFSVF